MNKKRKKNETEIMREILKNEIKMKPRWWFELISGGMRGAWLLSILAVSVSISILVFFIQIYKPGELALYGELGRDLFFIDFPYLWLAAAIVFFTGGIILWSRIGDNYKKTTKIIIGLMSLVVLIVTAGVMIIRWLLNLGV